jgi:hypothetical protein
MMIWIIFRIDVAIAQIKIKERYAARGEQIELLDFNPYCRDCDVPEGMDW